MPLWFTEGFNQHAYVSGVLLLRPATWRVRISDFNITAEAVPENAVEALNDVFPEGLRAIEIYPLADGGMKVGSIEWSQYRITWVLRMVRPRALPTMCAICSAAPWSRSSSAQARRKDGQYA